MPIGNSAHKFILSDTGEPSEHKTSSAKNINGKKDKRAHALLYLLWRSDAFLLIELCALLGFDVQAKAFLKSLLLQHQGRA